MTAPEASEATVTALPAPVILTVPLIVVFENEMALTMLCVWTDWEPEMIAPEASLETVMSPEPMIRTVPEVNRWFEAEIAEIGPVPVPPAAAEEMATLRASKLR
jgi:hypothetical protein